MHYTIYTSTNVHEKRMGCLEDKWICVYDKKMTIYEAERLFDLLKECGHSVQVFQGKKRGTLIMSHYV